MPNYTNHPKSYLFDAARQLRNAATRVTQAADTTEEERMQRLLREALTNIEAAVMRIRTDVVE
jgi:hypothetical protein